MDKTLDLINQVITSSTNSITVDINRVIEFKKGYHFKSHSHKRIEINFIKKGSCIMKFDNDVVRFRKNDCMVIFPHINHSFTVESKECVLVQLEFYAENFSILYPEYNNESLKFIYNLHTNSERYIKIIEHSQLSNCMERIISEISNKDDDYNILYRLYFCELFIILSRHIKNKILVKPDINNNNINKILHYFHNNYSENFNIEDISYKEGISSRYLRVFFRKHFGMSPVEYLISLRIKKSKELMHDINLSLTNIAYESGFSNQQYFSRTFKKSTGLTPMEYRKELLNKKNTKTPIQLQHKPHFNNNLDSK